MMMDWSDLDVGDLVRGKDGYTWEISARRGPQVTLTREHRPPFIGEPKGQVEVISTAALEMEKAKAITQVVLGGEEVARKGPNDVWLVPSVFSDPASLLSHGYLFHKVTGNGEAHLAALRHWHDQLHREPNDMEPHHHDPDYFKGRM
jgi:hypothetical protein